MTGILGGTLHECSRIGNEGSPQPGLPGRSPDTTDGLIGQWTTWTQERRSSSIHRAGIAVDVRTGKDKEGPCFRQRVMTGR
jgi:hypothetical protein